MRKQRRKTGSAITETGPALYILFIMIFFPMIDICQIGAAYAISQTYHDYTLRELAVRNPTDRAAAIEKVRRDFAGNPLFNTIRVQSFSADPPTYLTNSGSTVGPDDQAQRRNIERVQVKTTVTVSPFIPVPFFLPALVPLIEQTSRPQEEKGLN